MGARGAAAGVYLALGRSAFQSGESASYLRGQADHCCSGSARWASSIRAVVVSISISVGDSALQRGYTALATRRPANRPKQTRGTKAHPGHPHA